MPTLLQDLRFALRVLSKNPSFTAVAVVTLSLGIGATAAVFNLIQGVLLTPPPYPNPEQVVLISPVRIDRQPYVRGCLTGQWLEWQKEAKSFGTIAAYFWNFNILIRQDGSESIQGMHVTKGYFRVLGIKPVMGREFLPSEYPVPGATTFDTQRETAIILGYELWQRRFDGDPNIIGKTIHLSRHQAPLTVVGVMPPGVRFLPTPSAAQEPNYDVNARVDYWAPASPDETKPKEDSWTVVGRLRDGATLTQAQAELTRIAARQAEVEPDFEGITAKAQPLIVELNREERRLLLPLFGIVTLVFFIACANATGLLLARGLQRQQEYAVRCALGARRVQLFRQVLTESLLLAVLGGVFGAGLAFGTVKLLIIVAGSAIPRLDSVTVSWPMLGFCLGTSVLAAALAGLVPAFRASQMQPAYGLRGAGPTASAGRADRLLLRGVAALQTALTLASLVGAGLLIRTVSNLAKVRPGYDTNKILTMSVTDSRLLKFFDFHDQALARISALPGVKHVAFAWGLPLTGNKWMTTAKIQGQPDSDKLEKLTVPARSVTPEYFELLGQKILAGRNFPPTHSTETNRIVLPEIAIVNQAMAERYFPNASPVGMKLLIPGRENLPIEIIGVVANARTEALTRKAEPEIYFSLWEALAFTKSLVIRTASDPRPLIAVVQRELRAIEPTVAIENVKTLEQIRNDSVAPQTFAMRMLAGFSFAACALAVVGVYNVLSLSVSSRKREIAIRSAVGAQRRDIVVLVLREGFRLIAVGLAFGAGIALVLSRVLKSFLFGVQPSDPLVLLGGAVLFAAVALLACWLPARRAAKVDPMEALRYE